MRDGLKTATTLFLTDLFLYFFFHNEGRDFKAWAQIAPFIMDNLDLSDEDHELLVTLAEVMYAYVFQLSTLKSHTRVLQNSTLGKCNMLNACI